MGTLKPDFNNYKNAYIHLYNKTIPKVGRKMGHITITNKSLEHANNEADKIFNKLNKK